MNEKNQQVIIVVSAGQFYKKLGKIKNEFEKRNFEVLLNHDAITRLNNPIDPFICNNERAKIADNIGYQEYWYGDVFKKIDRSDCLYVANFDDDHVLYPKQGLADEDCLVFAGHALYKNKPIFLMKSRMGNFPVRNSLKVMADNTLKLEDKFKELGLDKYSKVEYYLKNIAGLQCVSTQQNIQENCLDKRMVIDVIKRLETVDDSGPYGSSMRSNYIIADTLKKELGIKC